MDAAFERDFRSLDEIFDFTDQFVQEQRFDESLRHVIYLVTEELFTNMVKYNTGAGNPIRIRLCRDNGHIRIQLVDEDVDYWDPKGLPAIGLEQLVENRKAGGLGLFIVRSVVDDLKYEYEDRRMKVTATKKLER
jgi:anti-sigma regulatory factor (Ser/Thr protein kinase)